MKDPGMERREFLKKAGLSAMALAAAPGLGHALATPVSKHRRGRIGFIFAALNDGGKDNAGNHKLFMTGYGTFGKNDVEGGGSYIHFDQDPAPVPPPPPFTLLETGTWRAKRLISWRMPEDPYNPYGQMISGILDLTVRLFPEGGPRGGVKARMAMI
jgi:hypothetical protein